MPLTQMRISRPMASLLRRAEAQKAALQIALAIIKNARFVFALIYAIDYSDKSISLGSRQHDAYDLIILWTIRGVLGDF